MSTIHLKATTTATPAQFVTCLTDFGPGRTDLFANSSDEYLEVHSRGLQQADVTEGSGGIWERLSYDWSDPYRVIMKTTDSNIWGGDSGHDYHFIPRSDGRTDVEVVVVREGKNARGRVTGLLLSTVGKGVLAKALRNTVRAVETRNEPSTQTAKQE